MKSSKIIEIVSSISALTSKILLFFENILGWPFSIIGYILVAIYNFREKYTLLAVTVSGLVFTCSYSWYKWAYEIQGLQLFDYIVIGLTALFGLVVYILKVRKDGLLGHLQGIVTVTVLSAFMLLGYKEYLYGWLCLFISYCILCYLYSKKKAYFYVTLQILSLTIALVKVIKLF